jgi:Domain of unknown function (DUF5916)/Carbohydrate family 9 binding domain-like
VPVVTFAAQNQHLRKLYFIALYCLFSFCKAYSQGKSPNETNFQTLIQKASAPLKIDGLLNEPAWDKVQIVTNFRQSFPYDTSQAKSKTEVRVLFDDKFLYVSAICHQPKKYTVQSLRRDFADGSTDVFLVTIDPFRDNLNGFYFSVSPYNVQKEGLISNGNVLNIDWDNKWLSAVKNYDDYYVVEIAIPFKTLRYKITDGINKWNINFVRNDLHRNERSGWAPIPRNFRMIDQSYSGTLEWSEPPPNAGTNISVIPYVIGESSKDYINNTGKPLGNAGFDAKIAITPSLNLDLTVNPDFSQVEVDRQITNLSRFELFFPERRQFFIENSDLFSGFGDDNTNPFFSRRIGITTNSITGLAEKVSIPAGARLSGRINKNWRVGLLNMQTARVKGDSAPAANFTVATLQRKIFKRSNLAFIWVNKENFLTDKVRSNINQFNRVLGIDMNMASASGFWQGKTYYHQSLQPNQSKGAYSAGAIVTFTKPQLNFESNWYAIGKGYNAEVGFVPRTGFYRSASTIFKNIFPKNGLSKKINYWSYGFDYDIIYSQFDNRVTDWDANLLFSVRFQTLAQLNITPLRREYTYLFDDFDPTNKNDPNFLALKKGSSYYYNSTRIRYNSNFRKQFFYNIQYRFGQYFNGNIQAIQADINLRVQPWALLQLSANYNRIRLPQGFNQADFWIIGPRTDITFSRQLFWTTFIQYNNQINNVNINSRLQWRFKPMSDLFIVYTNNMFAETMGADQRFHQKNNALVVKFNYWFNL